jgi:hypothetical protein
MGGKSSRAVKAPKYLNNYYLRDNNLIITMDGAKPNPGADVTPESPLPSSNPKSGKNGGAIPRTSAPSPNSAGMIKSLDETIMALTIENKRLEQEVLMKQNLMLKTQVPPTIQNKTSKQNLMLKTQVPPPYKKKQVNRI